MVPKVPARRFVSWLVTLLVLGTALLPQSVQAAAGGEAAVPSLSAFVAAVHDGNRNVLRGVHVGGVLALPIVQQPDSMYVSKEPGTVTQFAMAQEYGVTGLLAHNWLSGEAFSGLEAGQLVHLIYGDGRMLTYWVTDIQRYRATIPDGTYSDFVDLETGKGLDTDALFRRVYTGGNQVTFQTCIEKDGELSWGRLFVIAEPTAPTLALTRRSEVLLDPG
jgi:hypothetical protein